MLLNVNHDIYLSNITSSDQDRRRLVELLETKDVYSTTLTIPHPYTLVDADKWISRCEEIATKPGCIPDLVIRQSGTDQLIGMVGLGGNNKPLAEDFKGVLGYWLGKPYWNQGIMTAVVGKMVRFGFEACDDLVKISAYCFASNAGSARVLEKNGFLQEGYHRCHYKKDGELRDGKSFGLLRSDWRMR